MFIPAMEVPVVFPLLFTVAELPEMVGPDGMNMEAVVECDAEFKLDAKAATEVAALSQAMVTAGAVGAILILTATGAIVSDDASTCGAISRKASDERIVECILVWYLGNMNKK